MNFTLNDFCYKPISGEGCLVESPMQYFQDSNSQILNITDMAKVPQADCKNWNTTLSICEPLNPKTVAQCIPDPDETGRVCFDSIGTPVLTFAVFGGSLPSLFDRCTCYAGHLFASKKRLFDCDCRGMGAPSFYPQLQVF